MLYGIIRQIIEYKSKHGEIGPRVVDKKIHGISFTNLWNNNM